MGVFVHFGATHCAHTTRSVQKNRCSPYAREQRSAECVRSYLDAYIHTYIRTCAHMSRTRTRIAEMTRARTWSKGPADTPLSTDSEDRYGSEKRHSGTCEPGERERAPRMHHEVLPNDGDSRRNVSFARKQDVSIADRHLRPRSDCFRSFEK